MALEERYWQVTLRFRGGGTMLTGIQSPSVQHARMWSAVRVCGVGQVGVTEFGERVRRLERVEVREIPPPGGRCDT